MSILQPFKHLINEGQREVIFPGGLVEHPIIDTHTPSGDCPLRYELISFIPDNCLPSGYDTLEYSWVKATVVSVRLQIYS